MQVGHFNFVISLVAVTKRIIFSTPTNEIANAYSILISGIRGFKIEKFLVPNLRNIQIYYYFKIFLNLLVTMINIIIQNNVFNRIALKSSHAVNKSQNVSYSKTYLLVY